MRIPDLFTVHIILLLLLHLNIKPHKTDFRQTEITYIINNISVLLLFLHFTSDYTLYNLVCDE